MIRNEIFEKCAEHKHALIFAAGIATAIVGKKIIESKTVKDAEECFQDMKENAEEIVLDAHEEDKKEIYVEAKK